MLAAITGVITWLEAAWPVLSTMAIDMAPLVGFISRSIDGLSGSGEPVDQSTLDALKARLKPFEDDLAARAAAAQERLDQEGGAQ